AVSADRNVIARWAHRACGSGAVGTVAWRSLLTRFRTPRTAIETITGAGVGLAAALSPALFRDDPGAEAVLVGGAVQLGVLFMAGNSFGNDGPAVAYEMLAGAEPSVAAAGKARSILIVAAPLAVIGPVAAAAITDTWRFLPAGLGVGVGGLLAGVGAAVVQSCLVPIAVPESDNPFASGESGQGILAAALLVLVLVGLTIVTVPIGLALLWAADRGHAYAVAGLVVAAIVLGAAVYRGGVWFATRRLSGRDESFLASDALNKATDRTGSTMADRLDAEQDHVDQLRQTDDTGPLLRRALDSVDRGQDTPAEGDTAPAAEGAADSTPGTDEPDTRQP
ncbi:unnamed protein product, partial [Symbiodinium sp. KB8]